jgi:hypothetical protein
MKTNYEAPEIIELGQAEDVTFGEDTTNPDDHCGCNKPDMDLELF